MPSKVVQLQHPLGIRFRPRLSLLFAKLQQGASVETLEFQEGERLFRAHSHFDIVKGGTQGFPRHEVSNKQEVLFEDVSPSTAFSIRQHRMFVVCCLFVSYYRKRGSASYIVREVHSVRERERDTERDGSDVTIVALKLAMNLHVPFAKNSHNWRRLYTFPLPKTRTFRFSLHTSRLSLHWEVTIVALKFAMGSHFPLPKKFCPLCSHSFKWREPRDE